MLSSFPVALAVGAAAGFLSGLGIGGGSLLILWLTLALHMPQTEARTINLLFFLAAAGAVSFYRWKKGSLQIRNILPAIIAGCISAGIFAWLSYQLDVEKLRKLFGILLIGVGIRELIYRPKEFK